MPTRLGGDLLPPVRLTTALVLLRRRGVEVGRRRLLEAAAAGVIPARRDGGRWVVDEGDLDALAAYFRANPGGGLSVGPGAGSAGRGSGRRPGRRKVVSAASRPCSRRRASLGWRG